LLEIKLRGVRRNFEVTPDLVSRFEGMSYADIEQTVTRIIEAMVLNGEKTLTKERLTNLTPCPEVLSPPEEEVLEDKVAGGLV